MATNEKEVWLYESSSEDHHLTKDEESIMKAMRRLDKLWKKYKDNNGDNRLILFGGSASCSIRINTPSVDNEIEFYPHINSDGGDGGDSF